MKFTGDLQDALNEKIQIEAVVKKEKEIQYVLIESLRPKPGHTLFEINTKTLEIGLAEFITKKTISLFEAIQICDGTYNDEIMIKLDCVYISALNKKNAMKRYHENKGSAKLPEGGMDISELFF